MTYNIFMADRDMLDTEGLGGVRVLTEALKLRELRLGSNNFIA
jgi:hypothetical protein